jgi:drug/metabolite transporter (DMT)-like permease
MQKKPALAYVLGILFYFFGYTLFLVFYSIINAGTAEGTEECYLLGSLCFLVGSIALVAATLPSRQASKYLPVSKGASLFWGSVCFFIGSVFFTWDAVQVVHGDGYTPWLTKAGYAVFILGRLYFVWGSTTPEVGFLLRPMRTARRPSDCDGASESPSNQ